MESFDCPPGRKKLPGKHGQRDLSAAPATPLLIIQASENTSLSQLARLSLRRGRERRRLGRAGAVRSDRRRGLGERRRGSRARGETYDGERTSRRTFAADDA